ncbi:transporter [Flavobacterium sp. LM5]|uniref:TolC family protein n=1 Tax=Flavobacterium sp. LM5 TaxID=1938610 RepID=UPI0009938CDE|nr:TolC family protein [Flavobacterium sp. LM5]OOV29738.1 transporter [Flavobacterium sp. LM5]
MKISPLFVFGILCWGTSTANAQEKTPLKLEDAVQLAWTKSNDISLASSKVATKKYELQASKNNQYPDLKLSGQYQRLTNATIDLVPNSASAALPTGGPVDRLMLGQLTASVPVFAGFKIQNNIDLHDNLYQAETARAFQSKEEIALKVVNYYASLYKAQKTIEILKENQKRAKQRVVDFIDLEKNGIIPRNDLLKAQLQVSKIQLAIDEATNNWNIVNFYLVNLLKLDSATQIEIIEKDFANFQMTNIPVDEQPALQNRKDLEALRLQGKASESYIKIARSAYFPTIAILGGYTALDLHNVVSVQNAMNIGVGISYDFTSLLKNEALVKVAESKASEVHNTEALLTDYIKVQVQKAIEDYQLAIKQDVVYAEAIDQASENYRIVKDKYDNGLSNTNDLLEADVDQLTAKINKALSKANIIQKYYELLSVTGQLSQTFNPSNYK